MVKQKNDHRINVRKNMDIHCIKIKKAFEFFVSYTEKFMKC